MKKLVLVMFAFIFTVAHAQEAKKYAIKSGYLKLELTGSTVGFKEIWWDNYGARTCELVKAVTTTKMFGIKSVDETHQLTVVEKCKYWSVDYLKNTGSKGTLPYYTEMQQAVNEMTPAQQEAFADDLLKQMGGENLGTETVGNYSCDIISIMGSKSWLYKGISLKSEVSVMGITNYEKYIDFKPNTSVSASKFQAPADITYTDMDAIQQQTFAGLPVMDMEDDNNDIDGEPVVPVKYPFDKFKQVVGAFSYSGYMNMGVNSMEGVHAATFIKGFMGAGGSLMIAAESRMNATPNKHDSYEAFSHNGHNCYYGEVEDQDGTALVVEYPSYDMFIVIVAMPNMTKTELLAISDKLKF